MVSPLLINCDPFSEHAPCLLEITLMTHLGACTGNQQQSGGKLDIALGVFGAPIDMIGKSYACGSVGELSVEFNHFKAI